MLFAILRRDALITCAVNTGTALIAGVLVFSILGYMANLQVRLFRLHYSLNRLNRLSRSNRIILYTQGAEIEDVVNSGPGLVFLTYPDLVLSLPGSVLWAAIFFIMLLVNE